MISLPRQCPAKETIKHGSCTPLNTMILQGIAFHYFELMLLSSPAMK
jgi:hypothetical protein